MFNIILCRFSNRRNYNKKKKKFDKCIPPYLVTVPTYTIPN